MDSFIDLKNSLNDNSRKVYSKNNTSLGDIINLSILIILTLTFIYPFWNMYITALNDGKDTMTYGMVYLFPRHFTLDNIIMAIQNEYILNAFIVTISRTIIGSVAHVICCAMVGYALTKKKMPGRVFFAFFFFVSTLFSGGIVPIYLLMRQLHLINNYLIYIIPALYSFGDIIIFRCFVNALPDGLEESAQIDGASPLRTFFQIIVPLVLPAFATIGLFSAVGHWNDWYTTLIYIQNPKLYPLQTILQKMIQEAELIKDIVNSGRTEELGNMYESVTPDSARTAVLVITVTPIIMVYPFAQKYFVKGITIGSVKG